jgi:hypothetical protein
MSEEHRKRVFEHQLITHLFACDLEALFKTYQESKELAEVDADSTYLGMIYAIGRWRFGHKAWSDEHTEYFKKRARENAELGITTPGKYSKREAAKQLLSLADLGL